MVIKNVIRGIKYKYCNCFLEYTNFKDDLIEQKRLRCNINYQHKFGEKLKERFSTTYKFSNNDNNKFILLLQKRVYRYEYMDDQSKLRFLGRFLQSLKCGRYY